LFGQVASSQRERLDVSFEGRPGAREVVSGLTLLNAPKHFSQVARSAHLASTIAKPRPAAPQSATLSVLLRRVAFRLATWIIFVSPSATLRAAAPWRHRDQPITLVTINHAIIEDDPPSRGRLWPAVSIQCAIQAATRAKPDPRDEAQPAPPTPAPPPPAPPLASITASQMARHSSIRSSQPSSASCMSSWHS
jgi:hypothetical protein